MIHLQVGNTVAILDGGVISKNLMFRNSPNELVLDAVAVKGSFVNLFVLPEIYRP